MRAALALPTCILAALAVVGCRRTATPEELFEQTYKRKPSCAGASGAQDCGKLAALSPDPIKKAAYLEIGCTAAEGNDCVALTGTAESPSSVPKERAIVLLEKACDGPRPGRSCAELYYFIEGGFLLPGQQPDARTMIYAERGCALGGARGTWNGLGPSVCSAVASLYLTGSQKPKDPARAAQLYEQACEQEIVLGPPKAGVSCYLAARVYENQPLVGNDVPGRTPLDAARVKPLLQRGCSNGQSDSCGRLEQLAK